MGRAKIILKFLLYIVLFPLFLIYWALKSQTGKLAKTIVILVGLFLLPFWAAGIFAILSPSKPTKGPLPTPSVEPSLTTSVTPTPTEQATEKTFKVTRVIDGDTIEIEGGERVRYLGIDTPETVDPRKPVQCFGIEASKKNKELVEGKNVRLEKDITEKDKYGRLLRYVWLDSLFVNFELVKQGFATSYTYPPDVKYQAEILAAEAEARKANRGLWGACSLVSPTIEVQETSKGDCDIKGNISSSGEKIYHLPGCGSYAKTQIDESRGERWFCSEQQAQAAGWRKALNCP